jgi:hypothetical protein
MRLALFLILLSGNAFAQEWTVISRSDTRTYEVRNGSLDIGHTQASREPVASIIVRARDERTRSVDFEMNYVRLTACVEGFGKLVTTDLNGTALYSNDFVLGGGNVASTIAGVICGAARESVRQPKKGGGI